MVTATCISIFQSFFAVFKLINNGFSFKNGGGLDGVSSQMSIGDCFGNTFHNRGGGSNHGGRGGNVGSSNIGSRSSLNFNFYGFSSFDSYRGSGSNIWVVGIGISITSIVVVRVVIEPIVIVVVGVVTISTIVVSKVVSSLCFGLSFSLSLGVSFTFGQTGFLQGTDSATVRGNAISGGEGTGSNGYTSGGNRDSVGSD